MFLRPHEREYLELANGTGTELWSGVGARVLGGPASPPMEGISHFPVRQHEQRLLYVMQADGTNARIVTDLLNLEALQHGRPTGSRFCRRQKNTAFTLFRTG